MAECLILKNGGGIKSDDLTAMANMVLKGYTYMGKDSDDDILVGTLEPQLVGTFTGNQSIDVSQWKRETDTVNNFLIEMTNINGGSSSVTGPESWGGDWTARATTSSSTISKSLNENTLVINGASTSCDLINTGLSYEHHRHTISLTYKVYHI